MRGTLSMYLFIKFAGKSFALEKYETKLIATSKIRGRAVTPFQ